MAMKAVIIAVLTLVVGAVAQPFGCAASKRTVVVTGTGSVGVMTTIAVIRLGVEAEGATAGVVQAKLATDANRLVKFLQSQPGVTKLQTTGISLNEQRNFRTTPPTSLGFRGSNTVSFETAVTDAGKLLDAAVKNGATTISGVAFKATDTVLEKAREEAIRLGVANAKREAGIAAMAAGRRLGAAKTITINDGFTAAPRFARFAADASSSPVLPQEQQVTARVTIEFEQI